MQKEVTTQSHHELFSRIKRPKDCSVFNQTVLICTVPEQDPEVIADIEKAGEATQRLFSGTVSGSFGQSGVVGADCICSLQRC